MLISFRFEKVKSFFLNTLKGETFAGRNFHAFAVFGLFRESFLHEFFKGIKAIRLMDMPKIVRSFCLK